MFIVLDGVSTPIFLDHCDAILSPLTTVLGTWPYRCFQDNDAADTNGVISVTRDVGGYRIASPWLTPALVEQSEVGAVFSVTAELARAFAEEKPERLCLHCAAIEIDGRLVIFPNTEEAGKSTLAVKLVSYGLRLYADDVLPISELSREGTSLGVAPRLRLPLPATDAAFCQFVEMYRGPHDNEFAFLTLPPKLLAPHGQSAMIGGFVLLDRRSSSSAQFAVVPRGRGLQQLIVQNFAPGGTTMNTVDRLHGLLKQTPCFSLTYSNLNQAASLLQDRFSTHNAPWRVISGEEANESSKAEIVIEVQSKRTSVGALWFEQTPGVLLRAVDDDLFLVKADEDGVFHLNPIAATLWQLLERPTTLATAIGVLRKAFPAADARRVKRDVRNLFDTFEEGGLIRSFRR